MTMKEQRGFASPNEDDRRKVTSKGGKPHRKDAGEEWMSDEPRTAGRKRGPSSRPNKQPVDPDATNQERQE